MLPHVVGAAAWHANADEASLIDYTMQYKQDAQDALWAPDAYRASDHDAVVIGIAFEADEPGGPGEPGAGHPVFGDAHPVHGDDHPGRGFKAGKR